MSMRGKEMWSITFLAIPSTFASREDSSTLLDSMAALQRRVGEGRRVSGGLANDGRGPSWEGMK